MDEKEKKNVEGPCFCGDPSHPRCKTRMRSDNHSDIVRNNEVLIIKREHIKEMESMIDEKGRYSAESVRISRSRFDLSGLDCLANRSRALANDTLYLLRQFYFYHNTNDIERKNFYHRNIVGKFYQIIKNSKYSNEKKNAAIKILDDLFVNFRALRSVVPTIMKFMKSYDEIGYSICAQQIVIAVCYTFISHLSLIEDYYQDLRKWERIPNNQRGQKPSRPGLPRYIGKKLKGERVGKWKLIYTGQRLQHTKNIKSLENSVNNNRYTFYMFVPPSHEHIIPPIRVRTQVMSQLFKKGGFLEIIPKGNSYSFNIHYIKTKEQRVREYGLKYEKNPDRAISIDFGVNNFLTIFNNFGARFPIFKGSAIKRWNFRVNHTIPTLQRRADALTDVLERYEKNKKAGRLLSLESIINSRIHTYHDEFEILRTMILYIFRRISTLSGLDIRGLGNKDIILKSLQSRLFFRTMKNTDWDDFRKFAENEGRTFYSGIFNIIKTIILTDSTPEDKKDMFIEYLDYVKSRGSHKSKFLNRISNFSVGRLRNLLELYDLKIDELWDKYNRVKRDAISKIAKKLMYYCLYYGIGTITFGYNKGWQNRQNNTVKLRKLTRDLFVSLPFSQMVERIQVEAIYFGITVDYTPEWYTSKCSFIDNELIGKKPNGEYAGIRRFTQNGIKHNGLFRTRDGKVIHGDINGAANIGRKGHQKLFSKRMIAYNLGLISDPCRPLTNQIDQRVTKFITTPPISFSPSSGRPTKELKRKERLNKSKIKPQRYQMSLGDFLAMTQTAYV